MCGIAGKLYFDPARTVSLALLDRMNRVLAHRGPDDAGTFHRGAIGLAHRRLSIFDVSSAGHQPMSNPDETLWITHNGEIYNFPDLRRDLEREGMVFRSNTDTEVILALYERHGPACLRYLRGMFAFAIWDVRARTLFLARDRLGKKPLYYHADADKFVFASQPRAILQDPEIDIVPDLEAIDQYLSYGFIVSPACAYTGMRKLPPAHYLLVRDGTVQVERYWQLRYQPKSDRSVAAITEELLERLRESVRIRMRSDVPVGAFLSGGIDSATIVAMMSEVPSGRVKTFSIGFDDAAHNELAFARLVAQRCGTDHHEYVLTADALAVLPEVLSAYDEPFADPSAIPTYLLSRLTREHVTVALTGDGGDENFAGYTHYMTGPFVKGYASLPHPVRRFIEKQARATEEGGPYDAWRRRGKRFIAGVSRPSARRYGRGVSVFTDDWKARLYTPGFRERVAGAGTRDALDRIYDTLDAEDFVDATLGIDVGTYLPDDLLVKVDVAGMAHALEARSPLVDHIFMEFAASIPSQLKVHHFTRKHIFRKAVRDLVPEPILRRPKMGFGAPSGRWFRGPLSELAHDTLLSAASRDRGLFRQEVIRRMLTEHERGVAEWHLQLWTLLVLELWFARSGSR